VLEPGIPGRRRSQRTIDDLVDGVNRFPLAGTAPKNKNLGNKMEMRVIRVVALALSIFAEDNAGYADWLPTMAAKHSSKVGGLHNGGH